jgi:hypothetical protein
MNKNTITTIVTLDLVTDSKGETTVKSTMVELPDSTSSDDTNSKLIFECMMHGAAVAIDNALEKGFISSGKEAFTAINSYVKQIS